MSRAVSINAGRNLDCGDSFDAYLDPKEPMSNTMRWMPATSFATSHHGSSAGARNQSMIATIAKSAHRTPVLGHNIGIPTPNQPRPQGMKNHITIRTTESNNAEFWPGQTITNSSNLQNVFNTFGEHDNKWQLATSNARLQRQSTRPFIPQQHCRQLDGYNSSAPPSRPQSAVISLAQPTGVQNSLNLTYSSRNTNNGVISSYPPSGQRLLFTNQSGQRGGSTYVDQPPVPHSGIFNYESQPRFQPIGAHDPFEQIVNRTMNAQISTDQQVTSSMHVTSPATSSQSQSLPQVSFSQRPSQSQSHLSKAQSSHPPTPQSSHPAMPQSSHPAMPQSSHPAMPQSSHPDISRSTYPAMPQSSHPPTPQSSHPAMPQSSHPAMPQSSHPAMPQSSHPDISRSTYPAMPQSSHPPTPQRSHPPTPQSSHPPTPQKSHPPTPQSSHPAMSRNARSTVSPSYHPSISQNAHPAMSGSAQPASSRNTYPAMSQSARGTLGQQEALSLYRKPTQVTRDTYPLHNSSVSKSYQDSSSARRRTKSTRRTTQASPPVPKPTGLARVLYDMKNYNAANRQTSIKRINRIYNILGIAFKVLGMITAFLFIKDHIIRTYIEQPYFKAGQFYTRT